MKKKLFVTLSLIAGFCLNSSTQTTPWLNWAQAFGSASSESIDVIASDSNGDIIATGVFNGTVDFDPGPGVLELTSSNESAFIAKYDEDGNLIWVNEYLSSNWSRFEYLWIDDADNIYAAGSYFNNIDLVPGAGSTILTSSNNGGILIKLNSAGNIQYSQNLQASIGGCGLYGLTVNAAGEVYAVASQNGVVDYSNGLGSEIIDNQSGGSEYYLYKLNNSGNLEWVKDIGFYYSQIEADNSGNIFLSGWFFVTTQDIEPGAGITNATCSPSMMAIVVVKLDGDGSYLDHFTIEQSGGIGQTLDGICIDETTQDILISNRFTTSANFEPATTDHILSATSEYKAYVARYTNTGDFKWVSTVEGGVSSPDINVNYLISDEDGNCYLTGAIYSPYDMNPGPDVALIGGNYYTTYVLKWDSLGNFKWAYELLDQAEETCIMLSNDNSYLYFGGKVYNNCDIDPQGNTDVICVTGLGDNDFLLAKWNNCDIDTNMINNGSELLSMEQSSNATFQWFDPSGNPIPGANDATHFPTENGDYQVLITQGECAYFSNSVTITSAGLTYAEEPLLSVYPNPVSGQIFVSTNLNEPSQIKIVNTAGEFVFETSDENGNLNIDVNHFPTGVYYLQVTTINGVTHGSFVKN